MNLDRKKIIVTSTALALVVSTAVNMSALYSAGLEVSRQKYFRLGLYGLVAENFKQPCIEFLIAFLSCLLGFATILALFDFLFGHDYLPKIQKVIGTICGLLLVVVCGVWLFTVGIPSNKPNIILIVVDTLRADHLGAYGYRRKTSPTIDKFARENMLYSFAQAAAPWTLPSVAGIVSGFTPSVVGVFDLIGVNSEVNHLASRGEKGVVFEPDFATLAEILSNQGYETFSVSANPLLRDYLGFAQGYDHYEIRKTAIDAGELNQIVYRHLNSGELGDRPFFLYLHYFDPHESYAPPEEFRVFKGQPPGEFRYSAKDLKEINLYDGEIKYLDSQLAVLFDELKARNLYDDSIIILTSDHGEQFNEHGRTRHGGSVYNQEIHVPLIIKSDKLGRGRVDVTVSIIDIFATVLELVGVAQPEPTQSISLVSGLSQRGYRGTLVEGTLYTHEKALVNRSGTKARLTFSGENWNIVGSDQLETIEIFDSRKDILEKNPKEDVHFRTKMFNKFSKSYQKGLKFRKELTIEPTELQEITIQQLKSLGYVK